MTTHYTTLEIAPDADAEALEEAYERLSSHYDPARFADAAADIRALAADRYAAINAAYAELRDPSSRAAYDARLAAAAQAELQAEIDYTPLPAKGKPAPVSSLNRQRKRVNGWLVLALCLVLVSVGTAGIVWLGTRPPSVAAPAEMPLFAQMIAQEIPDSTVRDQLLTLDAYAAQASDATRTSPRDPAAWVQLGNAHYDFIQTIYEAAPDGQAYSLNINRWLTAAEAYSEALKLDPLQATVRSDLALAYIRYGLEMQQPQKVQEGLTEIERALRDDALTPLVLVNAGRAYALSGNATRANELWQQVQTQVPNTPEAAAARKFLEGGRP